jgi:putative spermidine/putrescine transport system ATP-binding protein
MTFDAAPSLSISVTELTKTYGDFFALNNVSIDVKAGEFLTLLGPSGSGKTTLLMAIAGFNRPDSGRVCFGDDDVTVLPPHKRGVGMVFQNYALFPHMSVFENVAFPLKLRKIADDEKYRRVTEALKTVQLSDFSERGIDQLSGGQRQRVALARAFVFGPKILLMDEPLSALDKKLRDEMQIELKQLHRQLGVTTVYVTHDQREALTMSDRIAVINNGELAQVGTPRDIYNAPASRFVASFIGESSFVPLTRDKAGALLYDGAKIAKAPDNKAPTNSGERNWSLVIRPERLSLQPPKARKTASKIQFHGDITELVYQGETAIVIIRLKDGQMLTARMNTRAGDDVDTLAIGQQLTVAIDKKDMIIIPGEAH